MFSTPDLAPDFVPPPLEPWSAYVLRLLRLKGTEDGVRCYNQERTPPGVTPITADVSWLIFPNHLANLNDEAKWAKADENHKRRNAQDEYCEWSVKKNQEGKIVKVVFTCELPEVYPITFALEVNQDSELQQVLGAHG